MLQTNLFVHPGVSGFTFPIDCWDIVRELRFPLTGPASTSRSYASHSSLPLLMTHGCQQWSSKGRQAYFPISSSWSVPSIPSRIGILLTGCRKNSMSSMASPSYASKHAAAPASLLSRKNWIIATFCQMEKWSSCPRSQTECNVMGHGKTLCSQPQPYPAKKFTNWIELLITNQQKQISH